MSVFADKPVHQPGPPRTYVRREGRLTDGQKRALSELLPQFTYPEDGRAPSEVFGREAPRVLEIGFGNGESLAAQAGKHRDQDFIGLEVHRPGVGYLLQAVEADKLSNVRVSSSDALLFLDQALPQASIDRVQVFFPDPWPKKRHHKRRIVRPDALDKIARVMKPGAVLVLATDWDNYAEQMMEVLSAHPAFENCHGDAQFAPRAERIVTRFERRAHRLGHTIHDLAFSRR
ncbi:MAG: tRNA (guanosine(46)-N7)-methyltransferase TrmB [Oceanococcus sp.]|nr:MAG: tRNA (guanosine(46)-N7)-methyltransferase TrmB [Oceanococcus sp.]